MKNINAFIQQNKGQWAFHYWQMPNENGYAAILAPSNQVYKMCEILKKNDKKGKDVAYYLLNDGAWLPVTIKDKLDDAIAHIDQILLNFDSDMHWEKDVFNAFQKIITAPTEVELNQAIVKRDPSLIRSGVVQPVNGFYLLQKEQKEMFLITMNARTLQVEEVQKLEGMPVGWTLKDVLDLLSEGRRFFKKETEQYV